MVKPDWWLVKIDTREHWRDDIREKTTAIYAVYAFDRALHVHIASLTPSYELHAVDYDAVPREDLSDEDQEALLEDMIDGTATDPPVDYMDVSTIERLLREHPELGRRLGAPEDTDEHGGSERIPPGAGPARDLPDEFREGWNTGALRF